MVMRKKTKQWSIAFILLIVVIILADVLVEKHNKKQVPNNTEKLKH